MMEIYRNKSKGGEGIHADLQYQPKLKNLNGIEALIGALGTKKLSAENLDKVATELPRLSYRIAVTGDLTRFAAGEGEGTLERTVGPDARCGARAGGVGAEEGCRRDSESCRIATELVHGMPS